MNDLIPFKGLRPTVRILACLLALVLTLWSVLFIAVILVLYLTVIVVYDLIQVFILTPYDFLCGLCGRKRKPT